MALWAFVHSLLKVRENNLSNAWTEEGGLLDHLIPGGHKKIKVKVPFVTDSQYVNPNT